MSEDEDYRNYLHIYFDYEEFKGWDREIATFEDDSLDLVKGMNELGNVRDVKTVRFCWHDVGGKDLQLRSWGGDETPEEDIRWRGFTMKGMNDLQEFEKEMMGSREDYPLNKGWIS